MKKILTCAAAATLMCAAFALGGCAETGHNFVKTVVDPTCTDVGYTVYTCADEGCGYTYKETGSSALGHNYEDNFCVRCDTLDPNAPETEGLEFLPIYDEKDENKITAWFVSKGEAEISNYIKIPKSYKGEASAYYDVVGIANNAFEGCTTVKQAVLPSSVKYIGNRAFADCNGLKYLDITSKTECIGNGAFENCADAFVDIALPKSVKEIGRGAFSGCDKVESITMPYAVGEIEQYTEPNDGGGTSVEKERRVNTHFGYIFGADDHTDNADIIPSSLENVVIEGSFDIPEYAFYAAPIKNVKIGGTIGKIGVSAFEDCTSLRSVQFEAAIVAIGGNAFKNCAEAFKNIVIPTSVSKIGNGAFAGCTSAEHVEMPYAVQGDGADRHFGYVFGSDGASSVPSSVRSVKIVGSLPIADGAFVGCGGITDAEVSGNISVIGKNTFADCASLERFVFGNNVTSFRGGVFKGCGALKRVEYGGSLAQYLSLELDDEYSSPIFNGAELYVRGKRIDILA